MPQGEPAGVEFVHASLLMPASIPPVDTLRAQTVAAPAKRDMFSTNAGVETAVFVEVAALIGGEEGELFCRPLPAQMFSHLAFTSLSPFPCREARTQGGVVIARW